jgi:hypothetical protein
MEINGTTLLVLEVEIEPWRLRLPWQPRNRREGSRQDQKERAVRILKKRH